MRRLAAIACVLSGCSGGAAAEHGAAPPPPQVEVAEVRAGSITVLRTYLGQVRSLARAELSAGASGDVREVLVREGDRVGEGAPLVLLDARIARAQLDAARASTSVRAAELEQAQRDAERLQRAGDHLVPGVEIERAASRARSLEAERRRGGALAAHARAELARHRVLAPFDGVVARRLVDPGDWVGAGTVLLEIVRDDALEVHVRAEPALLEWIAIGHPAILRRGARSVAGEVRAWVPALDPATRTVQLRVAPAEVPPWLLAGDGVDVELTIERADEGVVVPRDALVAGAVEARVMKVVAERAVAVPVEVVDRGAADVRVRAEGLAPGDRVVVRGNDRLRPDQPVRVVGE